MVKKYGMNGCATIDYKVGALIRVFVISHFLKKWLLKTAFPESFLAKNQVWKQILLYSAVNKAEAVIYLKRKNTSLLKKTLKKPSLEVAISKNVKSQTLYLNVRTLALDPFLIVAVARGVTGEAMRVLISASVIIAVFLRAAAALADLDAYFWVPSSRESIGSFQSSSRSPLSWQST